MEALRISNLLRELLPAEHQHFAQKLTWRYRGNARFLLTLGAGSLMPSAASKNRKLGWHKLCGRISSHGQLHRNHLQHRLGKPLR